MESRVSLVFQHLLKRKKTYINYCDPHFSRSRSGSNSCRDLALQKRKETKEDRQEQNRDRDIEVREEVKTVELRKLLV